MSVLSLFSHLPDPRVARTRRYPLGDLLLITLLGLMCGADNYVAIVFWAKSRQQWLHEALGIASVPSHDTLGRVLAKLDSVALADRLATWNRQLWEAIKQADEVIAFEVASVQPGKRIKGAANQLNLLSAWASRAQLTLGLTDAGKGGDEQEALRRLLALVNVSGCLVTADAMHTQTKTAKAIVERGADYVLALKNNQDTLHDSVVAYFDQIRLGATPPADFCLHRMSERGVVEERRCWTCQDAAFVDPWCQWAALKTLVCVERSVYKKHTEPLELIHQQTRYFVSSATGRASRFLRATRLHWGIENSQHWRLDVFFREDDCRVRTGQAATNLATLRRLALGFVKRDKTEKVGVQTKRQKAGWDTAYLEQLLAT